MTERLAQPSHTEPLQRVLFLELPRQVEQNAWGIRISITPSHHRNRDLLSTFPQLMPHTEILYMCSGVNVARSKSGRIGLSYAGPLAFEPYRIH